MTETAEPRDAAKDAIAIAGATLGRDLVATVLNELLTIPDHWSRLSETRQQQSLDAIKDRVKTAVDQCIAHLARGTYPAVPATLEYVTNKKGITAGLSIAKDALCRHELFDAQGARVLIVIADPARWMERVDEIKAKGDQMELFDADANYDPARDQPGYRRDQDPLAPAGKTWADIKKGLGVADPTPPVADSNLTPEQEREALQRMLQESLAELGVIVSLGAVQSWTDDEFKLAAAWAAAYATDPTTAPPAPEFLPPPLPPNKPEEK